MQTFLINLDRRPDRLRLVSEELARHGIEFERVRAVDGADERVGAEINRFRSFLFDGMNIPSPGAVGCYLSHRKVWQLIVARDTEQTLVLEDDALLDSWDPRFMNINIGSKDLDLLQVGYSKRRSYRTKEIFRNNGEFLGRTIIAQPVLGTLGYVITLEGAKKCLSAGDRYWFPVDRFDVWTDVFSLRTAAVFPPLCISRGDESDIRPVQGYRPRTRLKKLMQRIVVRFLSAAHQAKRRHSP